MKKLLIILMFSFISHSAFADNMQGKFICHFKFSNGSGDPQMYTINGNTLKTQYLDSKIPSNYKEIDTTYDRYKTFVSVGTNNSYQVLVMIAPSEEKDVIMVTLFDTEPYYKTNKVWGGNCKRFYG